MKQHSLLFLIFILPSALACQSGNSKSDSGSDADSDTDSYTTLDIPADTGSLVDSVTDPDTASAENPGIDTADGIGGADEECYIYNAGDSSMMWCDTPDLVMQQCTEYASGCCCRAPCSPAICEGMEEMLPCTVYDSQNE